MKTPIILCFLVIGTIFMIDRGPSAQQEAEDVAEVANEVMEPIAIPASYAEVKASQEQAGDIMAKRIAMAYAQGRADATREGCRGRMLISHPLN